MNEWISAKDGLPKENGDYLCVLESFAHRHIEVMGFANNLAKFDKDVFGKKKRKGWYLYDGEWGFIEMDNITHWMPLPELPEVKHQL